MRNRITYSYENKVKKSYCQFISFEISRNTIWSKTPRWQLKNLEIIAFTTLWVKQCFELEEYSTNLNQWKLGSNLSWSSKLFFQNCIGKILGKKIIVMDKYDFFSRCDWNYLMLSFGNWIQSISLNIGWSIKNTK